MTTRAGAGDIGESLPVAPTAGGGLSYDPSGRLLWFDNSTNSGHHEYEYTYDKVGNRATMAVTNSGGTEMHVYSYDDIYQITAVDYPTGYDPALATDTTFNYDAAGNRTTVIDAGGTSTYATNALNQYTSAGGVNYTYDTNGNMTYDGANMYAFDPENRLTTVQKVPEPLAAACDIALAFTTSGAANWASQTSDYYYDGDAVRSGAIGNSQESVLETTVQGTGRITFWWKTSTQTGDEAAFYIDGVWKAGRSGISGWNEVSEQITTTGTHTLRWKYMKDASGSSGSDCIWVDYIQWTGQMPVPPGWQTITYTYDPSGRRIEKKVDGVTEAKYLYDGDHIIAEYNGTGALLRKYIQGPSVDEPICMIEASGTYAGTYYYHYDGLGSVIALTNSSASVVELYEYSVYGQVAASDASHPNRFMFTGREFDKDTGLYCYRARYYNPGIGRFLQSDPAQDGTNWYAYCGNNPICLTDPSGEFSLGTTYNGHIKIGVDYFHGPWLAATGGITAAYLVDHYFTGNGVGLWFIGGHASDLLLQERDVRNTVKLWLMNNAPNWTQSSGATPNSKQSLYIECLVGDVEFRATSWRGYATGLLPFFDDPAIRNLLHDLPPGKCASEG